MKRLFTLLIIWMTSIALMSAMNNGGAIRGVVTDNNDEPVMGAVLQISTGKAIKGKTVTDKDGRYIIKALPADRYDITVRHLGFKEHITKGIVVSPDKHTEVNIKLEPSSTTMLEEIAIVDYKVPLIDKFQNGSSAPVILKDEVNVSPRRRTAQMTMAETLRRGHRKNIQFTPPVYYNPSRESYKKEKENDFMSVAANPLSTMSVDVDRASYSNIRRFLQNGQLPPADAVRIEEMVNYFDYNYPQPQGEQPIAIVTEITDCPWQPQHRLVHIGMQARSIDIEKLPASNLVFLVDVSGSMAEENKLPLVKQSLKLLAQNLRAKDKLAIVVYAGNAGLVLPPTPGTDKETIFDVLDRLSAGGSTAGGEGIKLAYKVALQNYIHGGNNRIILATDGDFNVGVSSDNELETLITKEREKGIYLTCLGYGMGNYKDSKMEVLADKGNGNYAYIDNIEEAKKTLGKEFGGTVFTVAKDVKAQIEFNPARVQAYRLVGYENRLLNEEDFKDDRKDAGDMGSGHSVTIIYEVIPVGVKSRKIRPVSDLKYQPTMQGKDFMPASSELATIKFRYKKPNGKTSMEMAHVIQGQAHNIYQADPNARFAASVAMFGMLLRRSEYKGTANYDKVLGLATAAKGEDAEKYRSEFISLVKKARALDNQSAADDADDELVGWFEEE